MVQETLIPGVSVAQIAHRHGVNANLLFSWRRQHQQGVLAERTRPPRAAKMLPVHVAAPSASSSAAVVSTIEIELPCGARVRVIGDVATEQLTAVLSAVARR
jgi:transposase